jgi:hypothetical protein
MNDVGFEVLGGTANVNYQGSIVNNSAAGGSSSQPLVHIDGPTAGTISLAYGNSTGTVANNLLPSVNGDWPAAMAVPAGLLANDPRRRFAKATQIGSRGTDKDAERMDHGEDLPVAL